MPALLLDPLLPVTASSYLPEIPESKATGSVANAYEDIRRVTGLPLVNLVYRYLASEPGRLEAAWRELQPNLVDRRTIEAAAAISGASRLSGGATISVAALEAIGLDDAERTRIRTTLAAYDRGNSRNLLAVLALLAGAEGTAEGGPTGGEETSIQADEILPIVGLEGLAEPTRRLLEEMGAALAAPGETVLVPGLLRHFARNPGLLALFWTLLEPRIDDGTVGHRAAQIEELGRQAIVSLPGRVTAIDESGVREVLDRFALTIPRMLVVGGILQASLGPSESIGP